MNPNVQLAPGQSLTPQQALELVRQVIANFSATGQQHELLRHAYEVLTEAIAPKPADKPLAEVTPIA